MKPDSVPVSHHRHDNKGEKVETDSIYCPLCGKEVTLSHYGSGWVGVCCDTIIYNSSKLPLSSG